MKNKTKPAEKDRQAVLAAMEIADAAQQRDSDRISVASATPTGWDEQVWARALIHAQAQLLAGALGLLQDLPAGVIAAPIEVSLRAAPWVETAVWEALTEAVGSKQSCGTFLEAALAGGRTTHLQVIVALASATARAQKVMR